jgi:hypothetical protein
MNRDVALVIFTAGIKSERPGRREWLRGTKSNQSINPTARWQGFHPCVEIADCVLVARGGLSPAFGGLLQTQSMRLLLHELNLETYENSCSS